MSGTIVKAQQALYAAKDAARRRALGPALKLADAALDTLAVVSEADVPAADALWRMANPGPLGDLLEAKPAEES